MMADYLFSHTCLTMQGSPCSPCSPCMAWGVRSETDHAAQTVQGGSLSKERAPCRMGCMG